MKGQHMMDKLKRMEQDKGPMTQFIAKQRDRQEALKTFSREEQNKLEGALDTMEGLKSRVKKEMALLRVIDITKNASAQDEQKGGSIAAPNVDKINYMIVKAKDQVSDAFDLLFSKDSKLNLPKSYKDTLL